MRTNNPGLITLTLNPAIDHILKLDSISLYSKNLVEKAFTFYGGKGINAAYALGKLGASCVAAGFIGEKELAPLTQKLDSVSVKTRFLAIHGNTRENFKVMDIQAKKDTEFNQPGFTVGPEEIIKLNAVLSGLFQQCNWLAISGSLPPGIDETYYAEIIRRAKGCGVKTCLDTSGKALRAGIAAQPALLRINLAELEEALGRKLDRQPEILAGMNELIDAGIEMVIVSMGKRGVIGCNTHEAWLVNVPEVKVTSLTGAGDTLTAGCLHALSTGQSFNEMLLSASALATASTLKMEPGDFDPQDLLKISKQTTLERL